MNYNQEFCKSKANLSLAGGSQQRSLWKNVCRAFLGLVLVVSIGALAGPALSQSPIPQSGNHTILQPPGNHGVTNGNQIITVLPYLPTVGPGFVDLHTHPLSNVGFGGFVLFGGNDEQSQVAANAANCNGPATGSTITDVLTDEQPVHGGINVNPLPGGGWNTNCGNAIRELTIHEIQESQTPPAYDPDDSTYATSGYPGFATWPTWDDITRQKMWVDWIQRSYNGGLRVMVALSVNSTLLATLAQASSFPTDDRGSADTQIQQTIAFVQRHSDFMQIAYSSSDVQNIVNSNKLAVILGMEIDNIGDWTVSGPQPSDAEVKAEIDRLYAEGVRYLFPIHLTDNAFGGTALYESVMPLANVYEEGAYQEPTCSQPGDDINYVFGFSGSGIAQYAIQQITNFNLFNSIPPNPAPCQPVNGQATGHVNSRGLTHLGTVAIQEMMNKGMLIDIDHMSQLATNATLDLAEAIPGGYPVNSGHNGLRCNPNTTSGCQSNERSLTAAQYARVFKLHGMVGIGSAATNAYQWAQMFNSVTQAEGVDSTGANAATAGAAFGTDTNGLAEGMPPDTLQTAQIKSHTPQYTACIAKNWNAKAHQCQSGDLTPSAYQSCVNNANADYANVESTCEKEYPDTVTTRCTTNCSDGLPPVVYSSSFPMSTLGNQSWDYNVVGVAHYGMLPDFLQAVKSAQGGQNIINNLMNGANYFYDTWRIAEERCYTLSNGANCGTNSPPNNNTGNNTGSNSHNCKAGTVWNESCKACLAPRGSCPVQCPPGTTYYAGSGCLKPGQHPN